MKIRRSCLVLVTLLFVALFASACAGTNGAGADAPDCTSDDVQKLITFCASPQAADLALQNARIGEATRGGDTSFTPLPVGKSPVLGEASAPVTIVMFTDLQCPYCSKAHRSLEAILEEFPQDVRLVFKHTPLDFHQDAVPAALGALAAGEQGKFWEYVDLAYANQSALSETDLVRYAEQVGVDVAKWKQSFGSSEHRAQIEQDIKLAQSVGVQGTPTMFINGIRIPGAYPQDVLRSIVAEQSTLVERMQKAGVDQQEIYHRLVAAQYQPVEAAEQVEEAPPEEPATVVAAVPVDGAPTKGAAAEDALVTIVTFSDFQCPFCTRALPTIDAVMEENAADTRLVYRHFPLPFHEQADEAAAAAAFMHEKGKFWEYHDLLFQNQQALQIADLERYAAELGVKVEDFEKTIDGYREQVARDIEIGSEVGVRGTPIFYVNGVQVMGAQPREVFDEIISEQRALASQIREQTGLVGDELYQAVVEANRTQAQ